MTPFLLRRAVPIALAGAAVAAPAAAAHADPAPLVVRGEATAVAGPCDARGCRVDLTGGRFRGTAGTGDYDGALLLRVADAFPNGEGGICAPLRGRLVLGAGTPDRRTVLLRGVSCQDGGGPLEGASFTGLARFTVAGRHRASGTALLAEDAQHRHRITLVGRA